MFGVTRCSCGSVITHDDLSCVGCGRVLKKAVGPPLKCDLCGQDAGTNPDCDRCHPERMKRDLENVIGPPLRPPLSDEELPFLRVRPVLIGSLCCALSVLGGYFWGRSDQRHYDRNVFELARRDLLTQMERDRESLERRIAQAQEAHLEPFLGPLRIHWGDPPDKTNIGLVNGLDALAPGHDEGPHFVREFEGPFGRVSSSQVSVRFCQNRLSSVIVSLPPSKEPAYRAWRELLQTSRISYGEPSSLARPTSAEVYEADLAAALEKADGGTVPDTQLAKVQQELRANPLYAEWEFPQKTAVRLSGSIAEKGADEGLTVLRWSFTKTDLESSCESHPTTDGGY